MIKLHLYIRSVRVAYNVLLRFYPRYLLMAQLFVDILKRDLKSVRPVTN